MTEPEYDLTDPQVFDLLMRNHKPEELTAGHALRSSIICEQDGEAWPCRIKRLLNNIDKPKWHD